MQVSTLITGCGKDGPFASISGDDGVKGDGTASLVLGPLNPLLRLHRVFDVSSAARERPSTTTMPKSRNHAYQGTAPYAPAVFAVATKTTRAPRSRPVTMYSVHFIVRDQFETLRL